VTDATNVGMLFTITKFTKDYSGNADLNRDLGEVNKESLRINFSVIKDIINNGASDVVKGTGIMFDLRYVEREQKGLTQTMERLEGKNSTFSNISKHLTVNSIFNTGGRAKEYIRAGNALTGNLMIDYSDERQRIGFRRALVFIKHLEEDNNFVGSSAYKDAVEFLNKDYGKTNVGNFLKTVGSNEDKK
jgi:hypothetical protein